jgi:flavin-dependent dehydrogenase
MAVTEWKLSPTFSVRRASLNVNMAEKIKCIQFVDASRWRENDSMEDNTVEGRRTMKVLIAGGGIAGLATALSLHAVGIEAEVFEQAREIREAGVGINMLPHAVKELAALGLLPVLDRVGIRTRELIYMTRLGQTVWQELRGIDAGYDTPQVSIHRGKLLGVLHEAALEQLGRAGIHTDRRLVGFEERGEEVVARFARRDGGEHIEAAGDALRTHAKIVESAGVLFWCRGIPSENRGL